ncbi:unnamed protein product [Tilletia laevis]|uniref:dolichyl-phosphate beta-glucosyltransferase n=3 Tax=Tilletia TaxID=13289 RepID=A0A8X7MS67_9BASI|nr:hypothetical protein CF336_g5672 [Tilletia laevis]KAE8198062.1 hypothetical protein CF328_g3658 [Tilletia controversa]KAE8261984.1 hypothetical protein A4X03_0g2810 [Tilletia caries]KAE8204125.1 hypothetical protein CF335_g2766 [Tilletia laevis]KAE8247426.1 hypothetical protein A4X06_0g4465 [Tilletia controversa]
MPSLPLLLSVPVALLLISLYPLLIFLTPHSRAALPSERHYLYTKPTPPPAANDNKSASADDNGAEDDSILSGKLPSIEQPATVQLSVVIPAYNEESRLPGMLTEAVEYLEGVRTAHRSLASAGPSSSSSSNGNGNATQNGKSQNVSPQAALQATLTSYEIVIVDDGSRDKTIAVALKLARKLGLAEGSGRELRIIKLEKNRGKGGAVRHGVLHSRGALILFADADGATRFSDLGMLCAEMDRVRTPTGHGAVLGSRAHLVGSEAVVKRSFVRNFLMHSFHLFLSLLLRPPSPARLLRAWNRARASSLKTAAPLAQPEIRDTQCGFKLFTRATAQHIFPLAHIDRWIFDVELLMLAEMASERTLRSGAGAVKRPSSSSTIKSKINSSPSLGQIHSEGEQGILLRLPLPIAEIPVHWAEVSGSKIELLKDSIGMALDLLILRANYGIGRWSRPGVVSVE